MTANKPGLPFDEVLVSGSGAGHVRYDAHDFLGLPLQERVELILSRRVRFLLKGQEVSSTQALRALREWLTR